LHQRDYQNFWPDCGSNNQLDVSLPTKLGGFMKEQIGESLKGKVSHTSPVSLEVSLTDPQSVSKVHSTIADLSASGSSALVALRGSVSAVVTILESLGEHAGKVSVVFSTRGDQPVRK
jgi:hypothetical protein